MLLWKGDKWDGNNGMLVYRCSNICVYGYIYKKVKGAECNGKGLDAEVSGLIWRLNVDTRTETFYQDNGW